METILDAYFFSIVYFEPKFLNCQLHGVAYCFKNYNLTIRYFFTKLGLHVTVFSILRVKRFYCSNYPNIHVPICSTGKLIKYNRKGKQLLTLFL